jgi:hypothetical protein
MSRHQTPYEIELNQKERLCLDEIDKLEMQEASLEWELALDGIDESCKSLAMNTLRVVSKALLAEHRKLEHIKELQITSLQVTLQAYGVD